MVSVWPLTLKKSNLKLLCSESMRLSTHAAPQLIEPTHLHFTTRLADQPKTHCWHLAFAKAAASGVHSFAV